jgi:hypothetical protein
MHTEYLLESLKGRDNPEDLDVDGGVKLKWMLAELGLGVWTG